MSVMDATRKTYFGQPEVHKGAIPSAVDVTNQITRALTLANMRKIWVGDPTMDGQALPTGINTPSISMGILIDNESWVEAPAGLIYVAFPRYHAGNLLEETATDAVAGYVFAGAEFVAGRYKTMGAGDVLTVDCAVPYFLIGSDTLNKNYEIIIIHEETPSIAAL